MGFLAEMTTPLGSSILWALLSVLVDVNVSLSSLDALPLAAAARFAKAEVRGTPRVEEDG